MNNLNVKWVLVVQHITLLFIVHRWLRWVVVVSLVIMLLSIFFEYLAGVERIDGSGQFLEGYDVEFEPAKKGKK